MACANPLTVIGRYGLRGWALFAFAVSVAALVLAYVSEYGFGLHPCAMCYWQRVPYAVVIVLALLAWFIPVARVRRALLWLSALAFAVGMGLAAFHAGVEWQWWEGPAACGGAIDATQSVEQILAQLKAAAVVSCGEAAIRVLGLSMAGWNALYSAAAMVVLAGGLWCGGRREGESHDA